MITFKKTSGSTTKTLPTTSDYIIWYAKNIEKVKYKKLYIRQKPGSPGALEYNRVELTDGSLYPIGRFIEEGRINLPVGARVFSTDSIVSKGGNDDDVLLDWEGKQIRLSCKPNRHWKAGGVEGIKRLWNANRLLRQEGLRIYKRYLDDFPYIELNHVWDDTRGEDDPEYVVQTHTKVIERCILMTTEPGDLVVDPTCGSGTTAYVAEEWGRRWITIDTSRVPLALAKQRLLVATYDYYMLMNEGRGPIGGFQYKRRQNRQGQEIGGIVPHITLGSIANNESTTEEVLVDQPEIDGRFVRVTGPFWFESTIPTPSEWDGAGLEPSGSEANPCESFVERMIEILRRSPILRLSGNRTISLKNVRQPAKEQAGNNFPILLRV